MQLFYKCNFIFWTEDSCWINKIYKKRDINIVFQIISKCSYFCFVNHFFISYCPHIAKYFYFFFLTRNKNAISYELNEIKKHPFIAFRVRCKTYYIVLLYTVRSNQFPNVCRSPDLSSASVIVFPQFLQWHYDNWLPLTVAGPYRSYTGFPFHLAFDKNIHQISNYF